MCNKLASRHVRVGLANPSDVPRCDICENAPGNAYISHVALHFFHLCLSFFSEIVPDRECW